MMNKWLAAIGVVMVALVGAQCNSKEAEKKMEANPSVVIETSEGSITVELWPDKASETKAYYTEFVAAESFPNNGGDRQSVLADFEFYSFAGTLKSPANKLKVEDYWEFSLLNKALEKLGRQ